MPEVTLSQLNQSLAGVHWHPAGLVQRLAPPVALRPWLIDRGSLTHALRRNCPELVVQVLSEVYRRPNAQEARTLNIPQTRLCWVRTIMMHCRGQPWVYARTVIPNLTPGNPWYPLKQLGNQPLGEVLFNTPNLVRSDFRLAHLSALHPQWFARQSVFEPPHARAPLLLTELFTQSIP